MLTPVRRRVNPNELSSIQHMRKYSIGHLIVRCTLRVTNVFERGSLLSLTLCTSDKQVVYLKAFDADAKRLNELQPSGKVLAFNGVAAKEVFNPTYHKSLLPYELRFNANSTVYEVPTDVKKERTVKSTFVDIVDNDSIIIKCVLDGEFQQFGNQLAATVLDREGSEAELFISEGEASALRKDHGDSVIQLQCTASKQGSLLKLYASTLKDVEFLPVSADSFFDAEEPACKMSRISLSENELDHPTP